MENNRVRNLLSALEKKSYADYRPVGRQHLRRPIQPSSSLSLHFDLNRRGVLPGLTVDSTD